MDAFPKPFIQRVRYDDQFAVSLETAYGERAEDERADWITHQPVSYTHLTLPTTPYV